MFEQTFSELKNRLQSGYNLREVLNLIDELRFQSLAVETHGRASQRQQYDLSVKNPHNKDEAALRTPAEILEEMKALDKESAAILATIKGLI